MLVLSRKVNERILIDGDIRITILNLRGNQVRIGIEAPEQIRVLREEISHRTDSSECPAGQVEAAVASVVREAAASI